MQASFEAVVRDPDGRTLALPPIKLDEPHPFGLVARVNSAAQRLCGAGITTLRCLSSEPTPDGGRHRRYELEAHGRVSALAEIEAELPPAGNPWEEVGWYDEASGWLRERAGAPVEQRSTGSISALLRAGDMYLKAVPRIFASEPAVTQRLYRHHPGRVPEVVDIDAERGWLLTREFGANLLAAEPLPNWVEAVEAYADLQLEWVDRAEELLALGCPDRTLSRLDEDLDVVLADAEAMLPGRSEGLAADQLEALPELRTRLRQASARVASLRIPPTLDHGDLHAENIVLRDGKPLFFDWSDACLALPLVSAAPMLLWDERPGIDRTAVRDAYLDRIGAPAEAFEDSLVLGLAHQAVSYHRITAGIAPHSRWEWESVLPWIAKQLLDR